MLIQTSNPRKLIKLSEPVSEIPVIRDKGLVNEAHDEPDLYCELLQFYSRDNFCASIDWSHNWEVLYSSYL